VCLLEALHIDLDTEDSSAVYAHAVAGGFLLADIREELTTIRKMLAAAFKAT
jgi:hypothetical protein